MHAEVEHVSLMLDRLIQMLAAELDGLDDEVINRDPPFQPSNTLYQNGFHVAGSTRWWLITNSGGKDFGRNRDAEFSSRGTAQELQANLAALRTEVAGHLASLQVEELDLPIILEHSGISHWSGPWPLTRRDAILHAVEHIGIHLGHVQITRQLFGCLATGDQG